MSNRTNTSVKIDENVWSDFKSYCAKNKQKMSDILNVILIKFLKNRNA